MSAFTAFLANARDPIDTELDRLLPGATAPPARLHGAMRYSVFAGGKRVRPALVLLTGEVLGVARHLLLPGGAALEMIHTYSLIHDDLPALDNDDLRRGRATLHRQCGEAMAILAGDALLTLGLTTLAVHPVSATAEQRCRAVQLVGEAVGTKGMIGGQVDDLAAESRFEKTPRPDEDAAVLESIHRRKTGALLAVCLRLAGIYAGAREADDGLLTRLGEQIGLMFQISDDILDVEGSSASLGKTAGKDAEAHKLTYPGLFGLEESKRRLARAGDEALATFAELQTAGSGELFPSLIHFLASRDH